MQPQLLLVLAFLAVPTASEFLGRRPQLGFAQETSSSVSTEDTARLWLRSHAGSPDELAELKSANPNAYAIVEALLSQRSRVVTERSRAIAQSVLAERSRVVDEQSRVVTERSAMVIEKKIAQAKNKDPKLMEWIGAAPTASSPKAQAAPKVQEPAPKMQKQANPYMLDLLKD